MGSIANTFGHRRNELPKPDPSLPLPDAKVGIEVEVENCRWRETSIPDLWEHHEDGSLRNNGREFTTTGGMVGTQITRAVDNLLPALKKVGATVGYPRAGIHLHVDCTEMCDEGNELDLWNLLQVYMLCEHTLFGFAEVESPDSRRACNYCDSLVNSRGDFENLAKATIKWNTLNNAQKSAVLKSTSKYQAINLIPLTDKGTVEFRHLPTTFDRERILTWIKIVLAVKRAAITTLRTPNFDLCAAFSKRGPHGLIRFLLGDEVAKYVEPFVVENEMWQAVDAIQGMAALVEEATTAPKMDWYGADSSLIRSKAAIPAKAKEQATPKKARTGADEAVIRAAQQAAQIEAIRQRRGEIDQQRARDLPQAPIAAMRILRQGERIQWANFPVNDPPAQIDPF